MTRKGPVFRSDIPQPGLSMRFREPEDVTSHFEHQLARLVAYVDAAVSGRRSIQGCHVTQLANKIGVPLKLGGRPINELPREAFVQPCCFDNIESLLAIGRMNWPEK